MQKIITVLESDQAEPELIKLITTILRVSKEISFLVSKGELSNIFGSTHAENIQGEIQTKLDVLTNQQLKCSLLNDKRVRAIASEEEEVVVEGHANAPYVVAFDPLDGSSNIDINGQIGTIFTIYKARDDVPDASCEQFKQSGRKQVCAGYILYAASTLLIMSTRGPTRCYTLEPTKGEYLLTQSSMSIPNKSTEFAVNMANYRHWNKETKSFYNKVLDTSEQYNGSLIRWNAAMVGDVHRILSRGGVFMYPADKRQNYTNGKIRLLYEANPLAMLMENAGGVATSNGKPILEIKPVTLHQRIPVVMGSRELVESINTQIHND